MLEKETENYLKMDPDPFDDRNPSRNPNCSFGHMLKVIFKKETFMSKVCFFLFLCFIEFCRDICSVLQLVGDYLRDTYWTRIGISSRDPRDLNTAAARLILDLMPGLEVSVVFQDTEGLVGKLFQWAEKGHEPLRSYATGLLASAMELQDLAANFREQNAYLVPIMLKRLWEIQRRCAEEKREAGLTTPQFRRGPKLDDEPLKTPSSLSKVKNRNSTPVSSKVTDEDTELMPGPIVDDQAVDRSKGKSLKRKINKGKSASKTSKKNGDLSGSASNNTSIHNESSNSSWAEMESYLIGEL